MHFTMHAMYAVFAMNEINAAVAIIAMQALSEMHVTVQCWITCKKAL